MQDKKKLLLSINLLNTTISIRQWALLFWMPLDSHEEWMLRLLAHVPWGGNSFCREGVNSYASGWLSLHCAEDSGWWWLSKEVDGGMFKLVCIFYTLIPPILPVSISAEGSGNRAALHRPTLPPKSCTRTGWGSAPRPEDGEEGVCDPDWLPPVPAHRHDPHQAPGTRKAEAFSAFLCLSFCMSAPSTPLCTPPQKHSEGLESSPSLMEEFN